VKLSRCSINLPALKAKDFTGELFDPRYLNPQGRRSSGIRGRGLMAWKAPKVVEVPVGMEINMYMCATRK
jgi:coenzyme PQQ precursor peptide PqqA